MPFPRFRLDLTLRSLHLSPPPCLATVAYAGCGQTRGLSPNGAKTQLLIHISTNSLLDLLILSGIFDRGY
jgi:hypothetical protein